MLDLVICMYVLIAEEFGNVSVIGIIAWIVLIMIVLMALIAITVEIADLFYKEEEDYEVTSMF